MDAYPAHDKQAPQASKCRAAIRHSMAYGASFLARDSIYAIARSLLTPVRPSVRLSVCPAVCHTGGSVKDGYS